MYWLFSPSIVKHFKIIVVVWLTFDLIFLLFLAFYRSTEPYFIFLIKTNGQLKPLKNTGILSLLLKLSINLPYLILLFKVFLLLFFSTRILPNNSFSVKSNWFSAPKIQLIVFYDLQFFLFAFSLIVHRFLNLLPTENK